MNADAKMMFLFIFGTLFILLFFTMIFGKFYFRFMVPIDYALKKMVQIDSGMVLQFF